MKAALIVLAGLAALAIVALLTFSSASLQCDVRPPRILLGPNENGPAIETPGQVLWEEAGQRTDTSLPGSWCRAVS
jgi:hypothetical protein